MYFCVGLNVLQSYSSLVAILPSSFNIYMISIVFSAYLLRNVIIFSGSYRMTSWTDHQANDTRDLVLEDGKLTCLFLSFVSCEMIYFPIKQIK